MGETQTREGEVKSKPVRDGENPRPFLCQASECLRTGLPQTVHSQASLLDGAEEFVLTLGINHTVNLSKAQQMESLPSTRV